MNKYCARPNGKYQKYFDVNVKSFRCGARTYLRLCTKLHGEYESQYPKTGGCKGQVSRAAGNNEGNFVDVPHDKMTQILSIRSYNPYTKGFVTFFHDDNCSELPTTFGA